MSDAGILLLVGRPGRSLQLCRFGANPTLGRQRQEELEQVAASSAAAAERSQARLRRLSLLCVLRKLYRNLLRADGLLRQPCPIIQTPELANGVSRHPHAYYPKRKPVVVDESEMDDEAKERRDAAVEVVAEMQLTAEQLRAELRTVTAGFKRFGEVLDGQAETGQTEQSVINRVRDYATRLEGRATDEISWLPFRSRTAAVAAIDARNARKLGNKPAAAETEDPRAVASSLEAAEKAVNKFVSRRLQPAVKKVRGTPVRRWAAGFRTGAGYAAGLWSRLNGTAPRAPPSWANRADGPLRSLPWPRVDPDARASIISSLSHSMDSLDKRLIEASKIREVKVRKAGMADRARLAAELRDMDREVAELSRGLAIKTLQLQMEYVASSLEDEALDIAQDTQNAGFFLLRQGSSDELALLVADFGLLDGQLAQMCDAIDQGHPADIDGDDLDRMAVEVPDLRARLGIGEATVFAGNGWTWVRVTGSFRDAYGKVQDGWQFFTRGLRLLGSDVSQAGRLFTSAALGASLKPREVLALRRTAQDVLAFIPFAVILIAPLTPVGHVLIFGFLQRYFPGFFPSQFSSRRQELVMRYEELRTQLRAAQEAAQVEDEEAELARATAAVARLTAPASMRMEPLAAGNVLTQLQAEGRESDGPAARAMRSLEKQVAAAEQKALRSIDGESDPD